MTGLERKPHSLKADPFACADDQNCAHRGQSSQITPARRSDRRNHLIARHDVGRILIPARGTTTRFRAAALRAQIENAAQGAGARTGFGTIWVPRSRQKAALNGAGYGETVFSRRRHGRAASPNPTYTYTTT